MDNKDLIPRIRKAFPIKNTEELKKAQEEFVSQANKLLEKDFEKNYFEMYGNSPDLYKFKSKK